MKVSIAHADTCLSDYWPGDSRPHFQIPAYRQTFASVRRALNDEINAGAVAGSDNHARMIAEHDETIMRKLRAAIMRDIKPARAGDRLAFRDIDPPGDCEECVYAFFVVIVEPCDKFYMRMGDDYLQDAKPYASKTAAINAFANTARELWRYGQKISASIHIAESLDDIAEYPDFILETGPRGGIRVESA